ncbi:hypothetical protein F0562_020592 [Nyssa sinensis]|uniref:Organ-specific protein S2 n=1 Tax=Nyssa sinensis TaxID=561372 RepID=A0A5J5BW64_9ASTE|nr:hypothetical protein F0562_020592 [Nyssa sinensis]
MGSISIFFVLFSLLLFANLMDARKNPEDYWKRVMKGEPMPKAIQDLVNQDPASLSNEKKEFKKDFDTRASAIIYHSHVEPDRDQDVKPFVKSFKPGHGADPEGEKSYFAKPVKQRLTVPEYNEAQKQRIYALYG